MTERKLTIKATAQGFEVTARQVDQLADAESKLADQIEKTNEAASDTPEKSGGGRASALGSMLLTALKIFAAIKIIGKAIALLPAVGAVIRGITAVTLVLWDEAKARVAVAEATMKQVEAQRALESVQRSQKATIERVASGRRGGGLTADGARSAQSGAERARNQFTQLEEGDVNRAFGLFGDLGFSQDELTDLSILQSAGALDIDPNQSNRNLAIRARRALDRNRDRINRFRGRETAQGQGLGDKNFRTGQPDERTLKAIAQFRTSGGPKDVLREVLGERLPADFPLDEFIDVADDYGNVDDIKHNSLKHPVLDRFKAIPTARIRRDHSSGFFAPLFEAVGFHDATVFTEEQIRSGVRELEQLENRGRPQTTIINNLQNSTFVGPDAHSRFNRTTNGESIAAAGERFQP